MNGRSVVRYIDAVERLDRVAGILGLSIEDLYRGYFLAVTFVRVLVAIRPELEPAR